MAYTEAGGLYGLENERMKEYYGSRDGVLNKFNVLKKIKISYLKNYLYLLRDMI